MSTSAGRPRPQSTSSSEEVAASVAARARLAKKKLLLPRRPRYGIPELPADLTEINDETLMQIFSELTRWQDYAARCLAEAEIDEQAAESMLDFVTAKLQIQNWDEAENKSTARVAIAKARATVDPLVQEWKEKTATARATRKLTGVMAETLARDCAVLSREISRRIGREPGERRVGRWNP
jgi:hypothetical protein